MPTTAQLQLIIDARKAKEGAAEATKATDDISKGAEQAAKSTDKATDSLNKHGGAIQGLLGHLKNLVAGFGALFAIHHVYEVLKEFDDGVAELRMSSDLTAVAARGMADELVKMSTVLPATSSQLMSIAASAMQLGVVGEANIEKFTATIAKLGAVTDMSGKEAAQTLVHFLTSTGEGVGQVDKLASTIERLHKETGASASTLASTGQRIAEMTAVFHVSSADALGLAAAMSKLGVDGGMGAMQVGKAFDAINDSIKGTTYASQKNMELLSQMLGKSKEDIKAAFKSDSTGVFTEFVDSLGALAHEGKDVTVVLDRFGIGSERMARLLPQLAQHSDLLTKALKSSREEMVLGTSLDEAAAIKKQTLGAAMAGLEKAVDRLLLALKPLGDAFASSVRELTEWINKGATFLEHLDRNHLAVEKFKQALTDIAPILKDIAIVMALAFSTQAAYILATMVLNMGKFAVNTLLANVQLSSMLQKVLVIGVAVAGWEIGTRLYEQFETLQKVVDRIALGLKTIGALLSGDFSGAANYADIANKADKHFFKGLSGFGMFGNDPSDSPNLDKANENLERINSATKGTSYVDYINRMTSSVKELFVALDTKTQEVLGIAKPEGMEENKFKATQVTEIDTTAQIEAKKALDDKMKSMQLELSLIGETSDAKDQARLKNTIDAQMQVAYAGNQAVINQKEQEFIDKLGQLQTAQKLETIANGIGDAFGNAFTDMATGAKTATAAIKDLVMGIERLIIQQTISQYISNAVSGGIGGMFRGSAPAGVNTVGESTFDEAGTGIVPHANGAVVWNNTSFNGGHDSMGEGGPEGILPLTRTRDGRLGVRSSGGGEGKTVMVNITVQTPDAESFRRSKAQVLREVQNHLRQ